MKLNLGNLDRAARILAGLVLIIMGVMTQGLVGTGLMVFGLVPLLTGLLGFCPLYSLFGWNTCPAKK